MSLHSLRRRVRALFSRHQVERELDEEMRMHLQLETDDLMRTHGLTREAAERQARLRFGGVDRHVETHRDVRGTRWIEDAATDVRYAARSLLHAPAFTLSAVLVLALGIGASTAIFSAVNTVMLAGLPYEGHDRIIRIFNQNSPTNRWAVSVADWQGIDQQQRTMTAVGALTIREIPVGAGAAEPARTRVAPTSAGVFSVLGIRAAVGRVIQKADEDISAPPVVVIADAFAKRAFGSAEAALGKSVHIDGRGVTVVGVLPPGVKDLGGYRSEIWQSFQPATPTRRGPFGNVLLGKLKPGVTRAANDAELRAISRRVGAQWSKGAPDTTTIYSAMALQTSLIGDAPKTLWMFAGAALLLLLTAVTNVANLMLARMSSRAREISLRATLGASRGRLVRLVAAESMLVSGLGVALGAVTAWLMLKMLIVIAGSMPRLSLATLDGRAVGFAIAVGLLTGLSIAIYPVFALLRRDTGAALQAGGRSVSTSRSTSRMRGILVAAEFALALPLLAGASQLMESSARLQRVDPGFDPEHLAYAQIVVPQARYDSSTKVMDYWRRAMFAVAAVPGVKTVGYSTELPPTGIGNENDFELEGSVLPPGAPKPVVPWMTASNGYFEALGLKLLQGRMFSANDTGPNGALIVSESFAKHYSADRPVVGRRIFEGGCTADTCNPTYIIGVVSDVKYNGLAESGEAAYSPATQGMFRGGYLFVKTTGDPVNAFSGIRAAIKSVDATAALDDLAPMTDRVYESSAQPRHWAMLLTGFAGAALMLAAVGIFGLLSYLVTMMRREIGVRVALGAQRGQIASMIVKRGMVNCAVGAVIGVVLALATRRLIQASLYDATAGDPVTLFLAAAGLLAVAAGAAWIPARRASRIDPMIAIRTD